MLVEEISRRSGGFVGGVSTVGGGEGAMRGEWARMGSGQRAQVLVQDAAELAPQTCWRWHRFGARGEHMLGMRRRVVGASATRSCLGRKHYHVKSEEIGRTACRIGLCRCLGRVWRQRNALWTAARNGRVTWPALAQHRGCWTMEARG